MSLTFLAVHAHPDDEASSSGGVLAQLADEGVRTIVVTCTNGECGDDPRGAKPLDDTHDGESVAEMRARELDHAIEILAVSRHERLGYRDSGMMGWPQNDDPRCFWRCDVAEAAEQLAALVREERPQVIMTYNEYGFYGHPDRIVANQVTRAMLELIDYEPTLVYNAIPSSVMAMFRERWAAEDARRRDEALARGEEPEPASEDDDRDLSTPDELVDYFVDVSAVTSRKRAALLAHASQLGDSFFVTMSEEEFAMAMGTEWFLRATNPLGLTGPSKDLFAGYR